MPRQKKRRRSSPVTGNPSGRGKRWRDIVAWSKTWPDENPGESSEITQNEAEDTERSCAMNRTVTENVDGNSDNSGVVAGDELIQNERENGGGGGEDSGSDIQFLREVDIESAPGGGRSLSIQEMKQKISEHQQFLASISTLSGAGIGTKNQPQMQDNRSSKQIMATSSSSANTSGSPRRTTVKVGQTTIFQLKNMLSKVVSEKLAEVRRINNNDVAAMKNSQDNIVDGLNRLIQHFENFALQQTLVQQELEQLKTEIRDFRTSGITPTQPPSLPERRAKRKAISHSNGINAKDGSGKRADVLVTKKKTTQCGAPAAKTGSPKGSIGNEIIRQVLRNTAPSVQTRSASRIAVHVPDMQ